MGIEKEDGIINQNSWSALSSPDAIRKRENTVYL